VSFMQRDCHYRCGLLARSLTPIHAFGVNIQTRAISVARA
jgi:hypothetical protein